MTPRARYALSAVACIALGLTVNLSGGALPSAARDIAGDALWAAMMASFVSAMRPSTARGWRCAIALAICYAVEGSQLVHAPALDAVRATRFGHLVLGSGFDPRDFASYALGIIVFATVDLRLGARGKDATDGRD